MRIFIGHRLIGGFWGGASFGRYRRGPRPHRDGGCGGCLTILAALAVIGLAVDYWPVTLAVAAVAITAVAIYARHRPHRVD